MVVPPFKWMGSKSRLVDLITSLIPPTSVYHEPFLGGGSIFLNHISGSHPAKIYYLSDINEDLINLWKSIQHNSKDLCAYLKELEFNYCKDKDFERRRLIYNNWRNCLDSKSGVEKAGIFFALIKTSFNGLVRYNKKGQFNAAFGEDKKGRVKRGNFNIESICFTSALINKQEVVFSVQNFTTTVRNCKPDDFFYLDPPYYETDRKIDALSYCKDGFSSHDLLMDNLTFLNKNGAKWLMSNNDCKWIRSRLPSGSSTVQVPLRKNFAGNPLKRMIIGEILAKNY